MTMNQENELKTLEHARSIIYRRLADAYLIPGINFFREMTELKRALGHLGSDALADAHCLVAALGQMENKQQLEVEYTRLFIGPFLAPAPPYGSVYLEQGRRLMGNSTINAQQYYLRRGFDVASNIKESPDHISIELEFMYALVRQGVGEIEAADCEELSQTVRLQMEFLQNHLGAWMPAFADRIIEHTRNLFYKHLAEVTKTFIAEELNLLASLLDMQAAQACDSVLATERSLQRI